MTQPDVPVADMISAPMEAVIVAVGSGIGRAQRELDRFAIQTVREIAEDPVLSEFGIQPNFYQIPRAELDITIAVALEEQPRQQTAAVPRPRLQPRLREIHLQPVNAGYTNQFSYDVRAASHLKLTFVPVPPPAADAAVAPLRTRDEVLAAAQSTLDKATGEKELEDARLAVNFNGLGRIWVVLLYRLQNDVATRLALVVVDDETGTVVKAEPA